MQDDKNRVDEIARLVRLAGSRTEPSPEGEQRVRRRVEAAWRTSVRRRRRNRALWVTGGSLAATLAVLFGLYRPGPFVPDETPVPEVRMGFVERSVGAPRVTVDGAERSLHEGMEIFSRDVLATGGEGRVALRLGTGHSIRMDRDSTLRFEDRETLVLEAGAVYVDSGSSATAVDVITSRGRIEEIGTQFEARMLAEVLRIRVREGEVRLRSEGQEGRAEAGAELRIAADGTLRRGTVAPHDPDWLWTQEIAPVFALEGRSLGEFLTWISRETGRDVQFSLPSLRASSWDVELHGDLEAMKPEQALAAVLPTCGLRYRASPEIYWIEETL